MIRTALALPVHEVCHTANFCSPHPSRTFKQFYIHIRCAVLSYFCYRFTRGASVTAAPNNRNAFAGTPRPALQRKRKRTAGGTELNQDTTVRYSLPAPAGRSLFYRRAGKGAPAKAFLLFRVTATLDPLEKRQQIYDRIMLRIIHNTCFESS